ncbi:hypothetical protein SAMN05192574_105416 [Mucilaginibacter gossypiicola]|uniref:Uncharacterized protein n=1 Tax=Mucilaginibacter gossypiicola TaxID=551995 RepID=A0A1H8M6U8_9SPHI|nr:hypothetical protein SAMN05192574_105416 [Mucilaginibacter gossypiicola]
MRETLIRKLKQKKRSINRYIRTYFVTKLSQRLFMNKYFAVSDIFFFTLLPVILIGVLNN